jgi:hypothetical protein
LEQVFVVDERAAERPAAEMVDLTLSKYPNSRVLSSRSLNTSFSLLGGQSEQLRASSRVRGFVCNDLRADVLIQIKSGQNLF